jgi:hypothetical protein
MSDLGGIIHRVPPCTMRTRAAFKHLLQMLPAFLLLHAACTAQVVGPLPLPYDDRVAKHGLWTDPHAAKQILADREAYHALEEQLRRLTEDQLAALFGASRPTTPAEFALPVHRHAAFAFSGLGYHGNQGSYFLSIGEAGGVQVFPYGDGSFVSTVVLYLKVDSNFIALRSPADYERRRAWEVKRTETLRAQIRAALSNCPPPQPKRLPKERLFTTDAFPHTPFSLGAPTPDFDDSQAVNGFRLAPKQSAGTRE